MRQFLDGRALFFRNEQPAGQCDVTSGPQFGFGARDDDGGSYWVVADERARAQLRPGDLVLGDDDGVVVVPVSLAPELAKKAGAHAEWEEFTRMRLAQGGELRKYYPLNDEAKIEYEEWKKQQGAE